MSCRILTIFIVPWTFVVKTSSVVRSGEWKWCRQMRTTLSTTPLSLTFPCPLSTTPYPIHDSLTYLFHFFGGCPERKGVADSERHYYVSYSENFLFPVPNENKFVGEGCLGRAFDHLRSKGSSNMLSLLQSGWGSCLEASGISYPKLPPYEQYDLVLWGFSPPAFS